MPRECPPALLGPGLPALTAALTLTSAPRDDDMQSLASLMSVKPSDVGNLDDFAESDEEETNGPGPPEARARVPPPGGLTTCHGLTSPRPGEGGGIPGR